MNKIKRNCLIIGLSVLALAICLLVGFGVQRAIIKKEYNQKYNIDTYTIISQKLTRAKNGFIIETYYFDYDSNYSYYNKKYYNTKDRKFYNVR